VPHHRVAEGRAFQLALRDDSHVLLPVDGRPLCLTQIVQTPSEDDVQGVDKSVWGRRQLHGWYVHGRLREEDGVARQGLLLDGRVVVSAQAHLLHAQSAQGCEHLGGPRCVADVQTFSANPIVVGTSVDGHLGLLGRDVDEAIPASPTTTTTTTMTTATTTTTIASTITISITITTTTTTITITASVYLVTWH